MLDILKTIQLPLSQKQLVYLFHIGIILWALGVVFLSFENGSLNYNEIFEIYGMTAWYLLVFTIYISLAFKITKEFKLINQIFILRKWAGISVFYFAFLHILLFFFLENWKFNSLVEHIVNNPLSYLSGLIGFIIILILFITSARYFKILLKKKWILLHKFAHLAFILIALHILFLDFSSDIELSTLIIIVPYFVGYAYLFYRKSKI